MSDKFTVEIITPDQTILKSDTTEVTIPSFEGQAGILKDHISFITFLRPGLIIIKNGEERKYYAEEGTVEFSNNNLLILTSTVKNLKNFDKKDINNLLDRATKELNNAKSTDKENYILSHKIDTLKEISGLLN